MVKHRFTLRGFLLLAAVSTLILVSTAVYSQVPSLPYETFYPPISADAASQQVPAGTKLKIRFVSLIDSSSSNVGDVFMAQASEDLWAGKQLILPKGTMLRGRVSSVERPGFLARVGL